MLVRHSLLARCHAKTLMILHSDPLISSEPGPVRDLFSQMAKPVGEIRYHCESQLESAEPK